MGERSAGGKPFKTELRAEAKQVAWHHETDLHGTSSCPFEAHRLINSLCALPMTAQGASCEMSAILDQDDEETEDDAYCEMQPCLGCNAECMNGV